MLLLPGAGRNWREQLTHHCPSPFSMAWGPLLLTPTQLSLPDRAAGSSNLTRSFLMCESGVEGINPITYRFHGVQRGSNSVTPPWEMVRTPYSHKTGTFHTLAGSRVLAHVSRLEFGFFCQVQNSVWQHEVSSTACQNAPALPRRGQLRG